MTLTQLVGMQYRMFVTNKSTGEYVISFKSLYNEDNCELEVKYMDDSNTKYDVNIKECIINNETYEINDGKVVGIKLIEGEKYKIQLSTGLNGLYTFEVKMYANR